MVNGEEKRSFPAGNVFFSLSPLGHVKKKPLLDLSYRVSPVFHYSVQISHPSFFIIMQQGGGEGGREG